MTQVTNIPAYTLEDAGFTRKQAEAIIKANDMQAASKADLERLRFELKEDITGLDVKIERQTGMTIKWMVGTQMASVALIITLIKLLG